MSYKNQDNWQLRIPLDAIVFDCDGTLSTIEGIDELANQNGVGQKVRSLTRTAMGQTGINPELYHQRLALTRPTKNQMLSLGHLYFENAVPDIHAVIKLFMRLNKSVYIVSAGLYPAVSQFGKLLGVNEDHIFAVEITFDENGFYHSFNAESPLVNQNGKRLIVDAIKNKKSNVGYIGDGLNDYVVYHTVTRFIGYGGVFFYEKLAKQCEFYINTLSMSSCLPLLLTESEVSNLLPAEKLLYQRGINAIKAGKIVVP